MSALRASSRRASPSSIQTGKFAPSGARQIAAPGGRGRPCSARARSGGERRGRTTRRARARARLVEWKGAEGG
eukprot:604376-Pleurochrysis_carterae.AAC.2